MNAIFQKIFLLTFLQHCCISPVAANSSKEIIVPKCRNEDPDTFSIPGCFCKTNYTTALSKTNLDMKFIEKYCYYNKTAKIIKIVSNFKSFDSEIFQTYSQVEYLNASHINLTTLNLTTYNLKVIDLSYDNLKELNVSFMKNLISLKISNNVLQSIEMCDLDKSNLNLENLDISFNKLSKLESFVFFPSLKYLNLSHNLIEDISVEFFDKFVNLIHLDLSYNKLKKFDIEIFHPLRKMQILEISYNNISSLDFEHFLEIFSSIKSIGARNNPLKCENLMEMKNHFESLGKKVSLNENCSSDKIHNVHSLVNKKQPTIPQSTRSHLQMTINKKYMYHTFSTEAPVIPKSNDNNKKNTSSRKILIEKLHQQNSEKVENILNKTMNNINSKFDTLNCRYEYILFYLKCIVFLIIILMVPIFIKLAITVKEKFYGNKKNKKDFLPLITYQK